MVDPSSSASTSKSFSWVPEFLLIGRKRLLLLVDNFETAIDGKNYMRQSSVNDKHPVGITYEPEDFVARVRDGLRIEELASINA